MLQLAAPHGATCPAVSSRFGPTSTPLPRRPLLLNTMPTVHIGYNIGFGSSCTAAALNESPSIVKDSTSNICAAHE